MLPLRLLPLFLLLGAQAEPASAPTTVSVTLSSFKFTPDTITLDHGRRYVLHLENTSDGGHNFVARTFFAAATLAPEDRGKVSKGAVELGGGEAVDLHLVAPAAGSYDVHCSHFLHKTFGMKGKIVVR